MEIVERETTTQSAQPTQIYDIDQDKMIDNPNLKKKEEKAEESEEEEEEIEKPKAKSKGTEEEEDEPESEEEGDEEEETEEESDEEESEEESEEEDEENPKAKDKNYEEFDSVDDLIGKTFSKYEVKSQAELESLVDNALELVDEVEVLKKQNEELKAAKPKFANAAQESAFNFVSQFDPKMQGEALQTFAKLIGMDIDTADGKMLLEERFIHDNPQWTRSEAQRMFKRDFDRRYSLAREKFDGTDEEFKQEQEELDLLRKGDEAKARTYLKDLREKHKPAAEQEQQPKVNKVVTQAIEENAKKYHDAVSKTAELTFGEGENKLIFKLDDKKRKHLYEGVEAWVKNPASYNEKGVLLGVNKPEDIINSLIGSMFLNEIVEAVSAQAKRKVTIQRVDELENKKPKSRRAPASGESMVDGDDLDAQAARLIAKRKLESRKKAA